MQTNWKMLYAAVGYDFDYGLRKLSDMTEEEDQIEFPKNNRGEFIDMHWYPEGYVWLLSKGFDLFGLLDAGVAIKKSQ